MYELQRTDFGNCACSRASDESIYAAIRARSRCERQQDVQSMACKGQDPWAREGSDA